MGHDLVDFIDQDGGVGRDGNSDGLGDASCNGYDLGGDRLGDRLGAIDGGVGEGLGDYLGDGLGDDGLGDGRSICSSNGDGFSQGGRKDHLGGFGYNSTHLNRLGLCLDLGSLRDLDLS